MRNLLQKYWNELEEQNKKGKLTQRLAITFNYNHTLSWKTKGKMTLPRVHKLPLRLLPWGPCCLSSTSGPATYQLPLLLCSFSNCWCYTCDHHHHCPTPDIADVVAEAATVKMQTETVKTASPLLQVSISFLPLGSSWQGILQNVFCSLPTTVVKRRLTTKLRDNGYYPTHGDTINKNLSSTSGIYEARQKAEGHKHMLMFASYH